MSVEQQAREHGEQQARLRNAGEPYVTPAFVTAGREPSPTKRAMRTAWLEGWASAVDYTINLEGTR